MPSRCSRSNATYVTGTSAERRTASARSAMCMRCWSSAKSLRASWSNATTSPSSATWWPASSALSPAQFGESFGQLEASRAAHRQAAVDVDERESPHAVPLDLVGPTIWIGRAVRRARPSSARCRTAEGRTCSSVSRPADPWFGRDHRVPAGLPGHGWTGPHPPPTDRARRRRARAVPPARHGCAHRGTQALPRARAEAAEKRHGEFGMRMVPPRRSGTLAIAPRSVAQSLVATSRTVRTTPIAKPASDSFCSSSARSAWLRTQSRTAPYNSSR